MNQNEWVAQFEATYHRNLRRHSLVQWGKMSANNRISARSLKNVRSRVPASDVFSR